MQRFQSPGSCEYATCAAERREHEILYEQLPDDPEPTRSNGEPYGDLTPLARASRQQDVGEVRAGYEQDQTGCRKDDEQRRTEVPDHFFVQRNDVRSTALVAPVCFRELGSDRV